MTIRFKVTEHRISSSELAIKLAEALNNVSLLQEEYAKYNQQAITEEGKLRQQEDLYSRILERDKLVAKGLPAPLPKKRMDPMLTYDAAAMAEEISKTRNRIVIFRNQSIISQQKAEGLKTQAKLLQVEIKKAVEREKNAAK